MKALCVCICIYVLLVETPKWSALGKKQTNIRTLKLVPSVRTDLFSVLVFDYISNYTYFNSILLYSFPILLKAVLFITYIVENYPTRMLSLQECNNALASYERVSLYIAREARTAWMSVSVLPSGEEPASCWIPSLFSQVCVTTNC